MPSTGELSHSNAPPVAVSDPKKRPIPPEAEAARVWDLQSDGIVRKGCRDPVRKIVLERKESTKKREHERNSNGKGKIQEHPVLLS